MFFNKIIKILNKYKYFFINFNFHIFYIFFYLKIFKKLIFFKKNSIILYKLLIYFLKTFFLL